MKPLKPYLNLLKPYSALVWAVIFAVLAGACLLFPAVHWYWNRGDIDGTVISVIGSHCSQGTKNQTEQSCSS